MACSAASDPVYGATVGTQSPAYGGQWKDSLYSPGRREQPSHAFVDPCRNSRMEDQLVQLCSQTRIGLGGSHYSRQGIGRPGRGRCILRHRESGLSKCIPPHRSLPPLKYTLSHSPALTTF